MLAELIKQSFGEIGAIEHSPLSPNRSLSLFVALRLGESGWRNLRFVCFYGQLLAVVP